MRRNSSSARSSVNGRGNAHIARSRDPRPSELRFDGIDGNCQLIGPQSDVGSIATATASGSCSENWSRPSVENANLPTSRRETAGARKSRAGIDGVPIVSGQRDLLGHIEPNRGQVRKRRA